MRVQFSSAWGGLPDLWRKKGVYFSYPLRGSAQGATLQRKLDDAGDEVATTIISVEKQFRG
jgi:hypothetical protein